MTEHPPKRKRFARLLPRNLKPICCSVETVHPLAGPEMDTHRDPPRCTNGTAAPRDREDTDANRYARGSGHRGDHHVHRLAKIR